MTNDDIIRMAREAGFEILEENEIGIGDGFHIQTDLVERFAALVAAHEREQCAKVCDARYMGDNNREDMEARRCADDIRARKSND